MRTGHGEIAEILYVDSLPAARILCPEHLIPAPGQYLLSRSDSDSLLPVPVFLTSSFPRGFICAPPIPPSWTPGKRVILRGPLGHGFTLPKSAQRVALIAFDGSPRRVLSLLESALKQNASVTLVCDSFPDDLSLQVEAQPLSALREVFAWADYAAMDAARESLPKLKEMFGLRKQLPASREAQILIHTPMPCGGIAECGICAVSVKSHWKMACKDGPVFDLEEII